MRALDFRWWAWHIFYHGDRNRVLTKLIQPVIGPLLLSREIDSFFFVRYALGGPHVRLRLRLAPERAERVEARLQEAAATFFELWPSITPLDESLIHKENLVLLIDAPLEADSTIYPDNFFQPFEFQPEIERYGGALLLEHSFNYFALSSTLVLQATMQHGEMPWAHQLPVGLGLLARQAWGFAATVDELLTLLTYAATFWGNASEKILQKGDRVFDQQPKVFCDLLRRELRPLTGSAPTDIAEGALRLSTAIGSADPPTRSRILRSHMHMLANRFGMRNPEEVYLSRILARSFEKLADSDSEIRREIEAGLATRNEIEPRGELRDLLFPTFLKVFGCP